MIRRKGFIMNLIQSIMVEQGGDDDGKDHDDGNDNFAHLCAKTCTP